MKDSVWVGLSLATVFVTYGFLIRGILGEKVKQSFATWMLWTLLDVIAAASIVLQKGNAALVIVHCMAGALITVMLAIKKQFYWSWFESMIVVLVIVCLVVWATAGDKVATIASTIAVGIASGPQIKLAWQKPEDSPPGIWVGFTLANFLSFVGGATWTIEDKFFPGFCAVLCLILVVLGIRKPSTSVVTA